MGIPSALVRKRSKPGLADVSGPLIHQRPLAYTAALAQRPESAIDLLVIHCTELPDLAMARSFGERVLYPESASGNSGHLYIDRDGRIEQWVELTRVAHHVRGFNERSVGIELVNMGRYPHWLGTAQQRMEEAYTEPQMISLLGLLKHLCQSLPALCWLAGHADLDRELVPAADDPATLVRRKLDPGPLFPWERIREATVLQPWPQPS
jgi:N-acetylmuramoyl-L-alanine amidase